MSDTDGGTDGGSGGGDGGSGGGNPGLPDVAPATTTGQVDGETADFGPFHIIWPDSAPQSTTRLWAGIDFTVTWAKVNNGPGDIAAHKDRFWITDDGVPNGDPVQSLVVDGAAITAGQPSQGRAQVTGLAVGTYTFHVFVNCDDANADTPVVHLNETRYDNNETFNGGLQFETPPSS
jgi:hypothetical protein